MARRRARFNLELYLLLCEKNYACLVQMLRQRRTSCLLSGPGQVAVEIRLRTAGRWVVNLSMRQKDRLHSDYPPIELRIRLYHDFQVAEIIRFQGRRPPMPGNASDNKIGFSANEKMLQSHFLHQWLQRLSTVEDLPHEAPIR